MTDDWMDELRRADGALLPTGAAGDVVRRGVAKRRRRRAAVATGSGAGAVLTAVGLALIPGLTVNPYPDRDSDSVPATEDATGDVTEPGLFDCPTDHRVFTDQTPPIADEARQQRTIDRLSGLVTPEFSMRYAETSPLGVIALVEGDERAAMRYLEPEGVTHVQPWDPSGPSVDLDERAQVRQVLSWEIDPVLREIDRSTRRIPGREGLAFWTDAGAVVVQWKAPVPVEVRALEGVRDNGVRVYVHPTTYSEKDIRRAQRAFGRALRRGELSVERGEWSSTYACQDGSGLVVGIVPEALANRRAELQKELASVVGMPVKVEPEERPVELSPVR
jgi:hypothetical protein